MSEPLCYCLWSDPIAGHYYKTLHDNGFVDCSSEPPSPSEGIRRVTPKEWDRLASGVVDKRGSKP